MSIHTQDINHAKKQIREGPRCLKASLRPLGKCVLLLSLLSREHIPGGFGKFSVPVQTPLPSLLFTTHTDSEGRSAPAQHQGEYDSLSHPDAHSTGLVLPSAACPWLSLTSEKTGVMLLGHFSLNMHVFRSLCPCTKPFLIVGLAPLGTSCSVGQHLDVFYCLYLLCTFGFPHLFSKAQC